MAEYVYDVSAAELAQVEGGAPVEQFSLSFQDIHFT